MTGATKNIDLVQRHPFAWRSPAQRDLSDSDNLSPEESRMGGSCDLVGSRHPRFIPSSPPTSVIHASIPSSPFHSVIPAKAGIQSNVHSGVPPPNGAPPFIRNTKPRQSQKALDSRLRGNDGVELVGVAGAPIRHPPFIPSSPRRRGSSRTSTAASPRQTALPALFATRKTDKVKRHWIPACAGMTELQAGMTELSSSGWLGRRSGIPNGFGRHGHNRV